MAAIYRVTVSSLLTRFIPPLCVSRSSSYRASIPRIDGTSVPFFISFPLLLISFSLASFLFSFANSRCMYQRGHLRSLKMNIGQTILLNSENLLRLSRRLYHRMLISSIIHRETRLSMYNRNQLRLVEPTLTTEQIK